ncbi:2-oxoacid:ferredoxin oxidoreductase subunit beta [Terracoccus luteus]|uniref:2-oxoglutarate ferredoxin oxidoreductase subunit beta n=1 Tax=Terracoccus luteus TaxID=53356 RepID=A0A495XX59_9MICO|nr:2-oxoacid:ferredoxin oxidoreductase subunit beta [Terracoccus luteus]MBB2986094.1 2-oxoglutarate ferredoxin oxidoreductase subunit beta [Terracoccus luteus]MCP2171746.1 2-oxoglutarate ferredoxin oxidoreductase subunit beta [Terracoccus luteus]RKT78857.1 2-oxoglutarate ferredoxin oxidoreductase subunit beta [Terracoccus luteus]
MTTDLGLPRTLAAGTDGVPRLPEGVSLGKRDFTSDQEVRWCPGCGDYAILAAVQGFLPELGLKRENVVFVSGIGCSSRFPYYLDTYGMHSIHGRAPAIATGLAASREDLSVWVVTGDGDALSIGGNHLIHALRRNVNLKILLFNNEIYGLTKGQYSPTSHVGQVTKSSPLGSVDRPFNPVSLALGAEATFVARTMDSDRAHLTSVLRAAAEHRGSALVEIYQNCPIFNDGVFDVLKDRTEAAARILHLAPGERVGAGENVVVRSDDGSLAFVPEADADPARVVVHDPAADDPSAAFALSRLDSPDLGHVPMGVFRSVARPTYDDGLREQITASRTGEVTDADIDALLAGRDTWTVGA